MIKYTTRRTRIQQDILIFEYYVALKHRKTKNQEAQITNFVSRTIQYPVPIKSICWNYELKSLTQFLDSELGKLKMNLSNF